jgi:hypothetical protein
VAIDRDVPADHARSGGRDRRATVRLAKRERVQHGDPKHGNYEKAAAVLIDRAQRLSAIALSAATRAESVARRA